LKKFWSNLKAQQRQAITRENQARMATGGGPEPAIINEIDPDIAALTPHLMATAPTIFSSNMSIDIMEGMFYNNENSLGDKNFKFKNQFFFRKPCNS